MKKKLFVNIIIILVLELQIISAQTGIPFKHYDIDYKDYINLVRTKNLEYAAEKLNINISEASIVAAKIFQDPYFSIDFIQDMEGGSRIDNGFSSELTKTIDLGGERKARIDLTRSEKELTSALLADYFRHLQADATLIYLEGMKHKQLYMVSYDSYQTMKKLYEADSIRLRLGSIMQIDAIQSKLEAGILLNDLTHSIAEWKNSLTDISLMTGTSKIDTLYLPSSHLHNVMREFLLDSLIIAALNNRADLQAAMYNKVASQKALRLTKKERNTDIDLKIGYADFYMADGVSPKATALTAGIAIPLKFSSLNKGEITIAELKVQQAEELFKQAELQIRSEIIQAWEMYQSYCRQVQNFKDGLLGNAENVRKGKIYSYQRGETSLLEVLNAQRTYNDIQITYYETLFNQAAALIELEKAAGIWDINF
jgi:cobalt-zinc-cadmium efflux system outer membrane protein